MKGQTADELITVVCREYIPRHGTPRIVITDNGQCFKANKWLDCAKTAGIEVRRTTPVYPQGNGKIERFNKTLKSLIAKAVNNDPKKWHECVGAALAAYRTSVSDVTGYTPFYLLYGRRAQVPLETFLSVEDNAFGNRLDELAQAYKQARTYMNPVSITVVNSMQGRMLTHHYAEEIQLR